MPQAMVKMQVRERENNAVIIDIRGEVTGFAENVLMDAYTSATALGVDAIILNFSEVEYINSSGIGLLVTLLIRAQRHQKRLMAYGLSDHYQKIFELTRLNEAILIFPDEEAALGAAIKSAD